MCDYGTIHASCGLGFPTAQIHVSRNRNSTSQRIAKWAVFMGLCECSEVIHSHLASCHSQIFSDLTAVYSQEGDWIIAKMTGVDAAGRPFNRTHRYKQDGREYPSEWGPPAQGVRGMLSVKKIDDHTAEVVLKFEDG